MRHQSLAILLVLVASVGWAADEPSLVVEYDPPRLSVDAHDVPLAQVLARIGAAVGFEVIGDAASTAVTISLRRVSVEDALKQLLQRENHTLVYRAPGAPGGPAAGLERVTLLRPPMEGSRTVEAPGQRPADDRTASPAPSPEAQRSWTPEAMPIPWWDRASDSQWLVDTGPSPIAVADMLAAHARSTVLAPHEPAESAAGGASASPAAVSHDPATALAETTRLAQQSLAGLMHGLATATRALHESLSSGLPNPD